MRVRFVYSAGLPPQLSGIQLLPMLFDVLAQQQAQQEQRAAIARQDAEIQRIEAQHVAEQKRIDSEAKAAIQKIESDARAQIDATEDKLKESNVHAQRAFANRRRMNSLLKACNDRNRKLQTVAMRFKAELERKK